MNETRVLPKLFGGPLHGKRRAELVRGHPSYYFPKVTTQAASIFVHENATVPPVQFRYEVYTRRSVSFGADTVLLFYAHSDTDNERAYAMLARYLLRGTVKLSS